MAGLCKETDGFCPGVFFLLDDLTMAFFWLENQLAGSATSFEPAAGPIVLNHFPLPCNEKSQN